MRIEVSLDKAKQENLFYFVVTGTIYHPRLKKCLILQRSFEETAHPGLWGVTGGKLAHTDFQQNSPTRKNHDIWDWEDLVDKLLMREAREESGLEVGDPRLIAKGFGFLRPDKVPVVCFKYALKWKKGRVKIDEKDFENYAWVNAREVRKYNIIDGIDKEVAETIKVYSKPL